MKKGLKNFITSLSVILLFSCAQQEPPVDPQERLIQKAIDSFGDVSDEEIGEIDVSKYDASDEKVGKNKKNKKSNEYTPMYQRPENQVKKIETKKIVIKPVNTYTNETHNFTSDEIKSFFKDIEETSELEEDKEYSSKSINILMDNYRNILAASTACCDTNISESSKMHGFSEHSLNEILDDDEDLFVKDKCLVVSSDDVRDVFERPVSDIVLEARKSCICNNKDFLKKNISNFYRLYNKNPDFYEKTLIYRYKDKKGDIREDDVNTSIINLAVTLESCP